MVTVCGAVCPGESQRAGDSLPSAGRAADGDQAAVGRAHLRAGQAEAEEEEEKEDETVATLLLLLFSVPAAFVVILAVSLSVLFVLVPLCSGSHCCVCPSRGVHGRLLGDDLTMLPYVRLAYTHAAVSGADW